jgi:hypothetical protein
MGFQGLVYSTQDYRVWFIQKPCVRLGFQAIGCSSPSRLVNTISTNYDNKQLEEFNLILRELTRALFDLIFTLVLKMLRSDRSLIYDHGF